jgi:hypothetical protein
MSEFFNTVNISGQELEMARAATTKQDERVILLFRQRGNSTPSEIHSLYVRLFGDCPLTSIRRAITCLTTEGVLEKTEVMKQGNYGKPNYVWKIK